MALLSLLSLSLLSFPALPTPPHPPHRHTYYIHVPHTVASLAHIHTHSLTRARALSLTHIPGYHLAGSGCPAPHSTLNALGTREGSTAETVSVCPPTRRSVHAPTYTLSSMFAAASGAVTRHSTCMRQCLCQCACTQTHEEHWVRVCPTCAGIHVLSAYVHTQRIFIYLSLYTCTYTHTHTQSHTHNHTHTHTHTHTQHIYQRAGLVEGETDQATADPRNC